ncbi:hypothetical protein ACLB2K_072793 [Fragaria x ananassa]
MGWPAGDFVLVLSVDFGWDVFGGAGLGFAWVQGTTTFGGDLVAKERASFYHGVWIEATTTTFYRVQRCAG